MVNVAKRWGPQRLDKDIVLTAVPQDGLALRYASPALQDHKEVVLAAVDQDGLALHYASPALQDDKDVVLQAVKPDGFGARIRLPSPAAGQTPRPRSRQAYRIGPPLRGRGAANAGLAGGKCALAFTDEPRPADGRNDTEATQEDLVLGMGLDLQG